ncbi:hypothetical protein [Anabaena sp. UHCC 0204]|uniref:hypothetical protein n=1 Tax=Anabaena sp. UHCC 0204 TaxID=2590009 RepID=UPI0014473440|nr:hypothetical protein [Anabaena sp. UHCC 0204]MTJ06671.1 hypothetical protein [Anabaena sp. UHCC 0204]
MKEYIIRDLVNFPLEVGNFDKYFYEAKKQLIEYLESSKKEYKKRKLQEIECIEPLESANNFIHYNFIFDAEDYCVQLFKTNRKDIAKGNIFEYSYKHSNNEFNRVKIGCWNVGLTRMFWLNVEKAKEYLISESKDLINQHPKSIIMFEAEKDMFKKDVILGFRFNENIAYSVFCKQTKGYAEPYKILDRYFNTREVRTLFKEELGADS